MADETERLFAPPPGYSLDAEGNLVQDPVAPVEGPPIPSPGMAQRLAPTIQKKMNSLEYIGSAIKQGFGSEPIVQFDKNDKEIMGGWGLIDDPDLNQHTLLGAFNETVLDTSAAGLDLVARLGRAALSGGAAFTSTAIGGATGVDDNYIDQMAKEFYNFGEFVAQVGTGPEATLFRPVAKGGKVVNEKVGTFPKPKDFDNAATIFGNPNTKLTMEKVYEQKGITPGEMVKDAYSDVTITQDMHLDLTPEQWKDGLVKTNKTQSFIYMPKHGGEPALYVYHGSPYRFDKFELNHIGAGEGTQWESWGLYFTEEVKAAQGYKKQPGVLDYYYKGDKLVLDNLDQEDRAFIGSLAGVKHKEGFDKIKTEEIHLYDNAIDRIKAELANADELQASYNERYITFGPQDGVTPTLEEFRAEQVKSLAHYENIVEKFRNVEFKDFTSQPRGGPRAPTLYVTKVDADPVKDFLPWDEPFKKWPQEVKDKLFNSKDPAIVKTLLYISDDGNFLKNLNTELGNLEHRKGLILEELLISEKLGNDNDIFLGEELKDIDKRIADLEKSRDTAQKDNFVIYAEGKDFYETLYKNLTGKDVEKNFGDYNSPEASKLLDSIGIKGTRYHGNIHHGKRNQNYVIYNDKNLKIMSRNDVMEEMGPMYPEVGYELEKLGINPKVLADTENPIHDVLAEVYMQQKAAKEIEKVNKEKITKLEEKVAKIDKAAKEADAPVTYDLDTAKDMMLSKIELEGKTFKEEVSWGDYYYTRLVDMVNPVRAAAIKVFGKAGEKALSAERSPYKRFRLLEGAAGQADAMIKYGTRNFSNWKVNGIGLREVLGQVKKAKGKLNDFRAYITAKRAIELDKRGIAQPFNVDAAKVVAGDEAMIAKYEPIHRELVAFQNRVLQYLNDAGWLTAKAHDAILKANEEYVPFHHFFDPDNWPSDYYMAVGMAPKNPLKEIEGNMSKIVDPIESILKNTYALIAAAEKNDAANLLIDMLDKKNIKAIQKELKKNADAVKNLPNKGKQLAFDFKGDDNLVTPITDMSALAKEEAQIKKMLERHGVDNEDLAKIIATTMGGGKKGSVYAWKDGKPRFRAIDDPELMAWWSALDKQTIGLITKIVSVPAQFARAGIIFDLTFIARQLIFDNMMAFINTGLHPINSLEGFGSVMLGKVFRKKDTKYADWLMSGGANSSMVALERKYFEDSLTESRTTWGHVVNSTWNGMQLVLRAPRAVTEVIDNSYRVGQYIKTTRAIRNKEKKTDVSKADMREAGFDSREVTLDFAKRGAQMTSYSMMTNFLSASINGMDQVVRMFKERPVATFLKSVGLITSASVINWWVNHDNPAYKAEPLWRKNATWPIYIPNWREATFQEALDKKNKGFIKEENGKLYINDYFPIYIPKPFQLGLVFGSLPERVLDKWADDNPRAFNDFNKSMMAVFALPYIPTVGTGIFEQATNTRMFTGQPLVSKSMEEHLPEYQYTQYTTEVAKAVGAAFAAVPGIRTVGGPGIANALSNPILLENYVSNFTGGVGRDLMKVLDAGLQEAGLLPDKPGPFSDLSEWPIIRGFTTRYKWANSQFIQDFYDRNATNAQIIATLRYRIKELDTDAANAILDKYGPRQTLDGIQQALSMMNWQIRQTNKMPEDQLPAQQKKQAIESIYYRMNDLAIQGNKALDEMDAVVQKILDTHKQILDKRKQK